MSTESMDITKTAKRKRRTKEEGGKRVSPGVCYMGRIPPRMDPPTVRKLLSEYGDVGRIYLAPAKNASTKVRVTKVGRFQRMKFSEGWVEFSDKRVAKRVANMLNGEKIGGKKRSSLYEDLWSIKYLSKFKWDSLTEETAYKKATREQKLALEISAGKKERDLYLSKVDKSRGLNAIEERLKKRRVQEDSEVDPDVPVSHPEVIRTFKQTAPVADTTAKTKTRLSKDILAGIFGGS